MRLGEIKIMIESMMRVVMSRATTKGWVWEVLTQRWWMRKS